VTVLVTVAGPRSADDEADGCGVLAIVDERAFEERLEIGSDEEADITFTHDQVLGSLRVVDAQPPSMDAAVGPAHDLDAHCGARWPLRGKDALQLGSGAWGDGEHHISSLMVASGEDLRRRSDRRCSSR
jgi:hypothetical protein